MEVSVVIPNFNGIAFLDSVLASLEGQTLSNFEVILVDNGSTDGSCSFVTANYPWVHLIELSENFGFCGAVNAGIRAAKAPYVLLLLLYHYLKAEHTCGKSTVCSAFK